LGGKLTPAEGGEIKSEHGRTTRKITAFSISKIAQETGGKKEGDETFDTQGRGECMGGEKKALAPPMKIRPAGTP